MTSRWLDYAHEEEEEEEEDEGEGEDEDEAEEAEDAAEAPKARLPSIEAMACIGSEDFTGIARTHGIDNIGIKNTPTEQCHRVGGRGPFSDFKVDVGHTGNFEDTMTKHSLERQIVDGQ